LETGFTPEKTVYGIRFWVPFSNPRSRRVPPTAENPLTTVAFKMNLEHTIRETTVRDVIWNITKHGRLFPVVKFQPVFIDGARITSASGHNARKCIFEWGLAVGTKIRVTRSGGVIPKVIDVIEDEGYFSKSEETRSDTRREKVKPIYPPNTYPWKWQGCDIVLVDPESVPEVWINRSVSFFETLHIPGIREGMVSRMYDGGLRSLQHIINASPQRLMECRGIGPSRSQTFYQAIQKGINNAKLYRLMPASSCFPKGLGKKLLRLIAVNLPGFLSLPPHDPETLRRLSSIHGIGPARSQMFLEGLPKFQAFLTNFPSVSSNNFMYFEQLRLNGRNPNVEGRSFVFTCLEDELLEDYLLDHGGIMQTSVTRDTQAVVCGNLAEVTGKQTQAISLRIPIYTVEEFKWLYSIRW
jgi:DNA ligase (NAD+)